MIFYGLFQWYMTNKGKSGLEIGYSSLKINILLVSQVKKWYKVGQSGEKCC